MRGVRLLSLAQSDPTAVADGWRRLNPLNRMLLGWLDAARVHTVEAIARAVTLASASAPTDVLPAHAPALLRVHTAGDDM